MKINYDDLKLNYVLSCIKLLESTDSQSLSYIESRYNNIAENFQITIMFLETIELIQVVEATQIIRSDTFEHVSADFINSETYRATFVLNYLNNSSNHFFTQFQKYFEMFHLVSGRLGYSPSFKTNLKFSGIRNFLIDLGIVEYHHGEEYYYINDNFSPSLLTIKIKPSITQEELDNRIKAQREIGFLAELRIILYEKKRLIKRADLIGMIDHVARNDVNAGYDIKSFEIDSPNDYPIERHIEVKAVPKDTLRFFWSINEINQAKIGKEQYFLYLLPVFRKNEFDINDLKMISDPYKNIFNNRVDWEMREANYCFRKRII